MIVNAAKCYFADHPPVKIILIFLVFWPAADLAMREKREPVAPAFWLFYLLQIALAGGNRAACHFDNQMRPIGRGCVDILHQPVVRDAYAIQGFCVKTGR